MNEELMKQVYKDQKRKYEEDARKASNEEEQNAAIMLAKFF